jgi:succinate dehydrogenase / fumarate reductase membrane anchor subunit
VPLALWFTASVLAHLGSDHAAFVAWFRSPIPAVLMIVLIGATFWHAALGLQVVVEDYVHGEGTKLATLVILKLACLVLAVAGIFAVLRMALGAF